MYQQGFRYRQGIAFCIHIKVQHGQLLDVIGARIAEIDDGLLMYVASIRHKLRKNKPTESKADMLVY